MRILAIETSCDDTGVAILEIRNSKFEIRSNVVASQAIHQQYGGVFPAMAKREHQRNLLPVFQQALTEANVIFNFQFTISNEQREVLNSILAREPELLQQLIPFLETHQKPEVDAITIVNGPGLEPCLWVGVNFARALSYIWDIPLVPVNHIESHILVNWLENKQIALPALSLVVSGGHTQLILVKAVGDYEIIGETRDDAAGECFDKCAKLLGLGYPGGPIISQLAKEFAGERTIVLPRPMIDSKDYDFSFSGLKTAVLYAIRDSKFEIQNSKFRIEMAHEVQDAIIEVLLKKTFQAAEQYDVKTIILGGGVSANQELRKQFLLHASGSMLQVVIPPAHLSTDNALMSAVTGYFHSKKRASWETLEADANLRV